MSTTKLINNEVHNTSANHNQVTKPLLEKNEKPPLATSESIDEDDDRETVNAPYPGVDDGFFNEHKNNQPKSDVENIPPETHHLPEIPDITSRIGPTDDAPTDDAPTDENDGRKVPPSTNGSDIPLSHYPEKPRFPYSPGFGHDIEVGSFPDIEGSIPDVNVYQHKKTLAQGMMDLALFSANANQLRYVLETFSRHPYYYPSVIFISISLIMQVAVGIGLIWNATYNVKDKKEICIANKINNFTIIGIFLITVINVFISAFGVASAE